jgi:predicted NBD/HSP70 family sugar kinase
LGYYYKNIQLLEEDSMIYIYIGKNCPGAGIIINGEVVRGFTAFAGEIGLLPLKDLNLPINSDRLREEQDRLIDWAAKIIVSATCMINPKYVVLCDAQITELTKSAIEKSCLKYIPCYSMPQILMSDDFYGDYYEGLKKIGLDAINTHYKVIHS